MSRGLFLLIFALVILVIALFFLVRVAPQDSAFTTPTPQAKLKVAATIFPLYDMVRTVAGDVAEVKLILPPGASPHTFEVLPSNLRELQNTHTVFAIGHGADNWTQVIADSLGSEVVGVSGGIVLRELDVDADEHEHEGSGGHSHEGDVYFDDAQGLLDPHYWLHFENAKQMVRNIQHELSHIDQQNSGLYKENADTFVAELEIKEQELQTLLSDLSSRNIVTLHDGWFYFADNFDLSVVGFLEPSGGQEPTPRQLVTLTEVVKEYDVKLIFSESQLSGTSLRAFAEENKLGIAHLDPLGGVFKRLSYIELMEYNIQVVADALSSR